MTRHRVFIPLFAAVVLLVQSHGLWHQHDPDDHDHDHHCVFCMALAPLDHGLSMAIPTMPPISGTVVIVSESGSPSTTSIPTIVYSSRAPPVSHLS